MNFNLIVTLGPSILNHPSRLAEIADLGPCIFRINGAHSGPERTRATIERCRSLRPGIRLMIDLPGNKVRTSDLDDPIPLVKGEEITLLPDQVTVPEWWRYIEPGQTVLAHDAKYELEIVETADWGVRLLSRSDGVLASKKGLSVPGLADSLPFLFPKDYDLIDVGNADAIDFLSLSFVRTPHDVKQTRLQVSSLNTKIVAKIETELALHNLDGIREAADAINVDRGDLAAAIGLIQIPTAQKAVVTYGGREVYLATQFLASMVESPVPLIAEVIDLHRTIESGVRGIQLSEETAVGRYPVECVRLVFDLVAKVLG